MRTVFQNLIIAIFLIIVMIFSLSSLKAQNATQPAEPTIVPIPTLCGPSREFFMVMKDQKYIPIITNNSDKKLFVVFAQKQSKNVVVTVTIETMTCILANEESADIDLKSLFEEM